MCTTCVDLTDAFLAIFNDLLILHVIRSQKDSLNFLLRKAYKMGLLALFRYLMRNVIGVNKLLKKEPPE